jgi:hypothetical protein
LIRLPHPTLFPSPVKRGAGSGRLAKGRTKDRGLAEGEHQHFKGDLDCSGEEKRGYGAFGVKALKGLKARAAIASFQESKPTKIQSSAKTYNSRDSLVVTHPTTNLPACGLSTAERTGSPVLHTLWSYVQNTMYIEIIILLYTGTFLSI